MRQLYISADLEGVCGVTSVRQVFPKPEDLPRYREAVAQLAKEVLAVVRAAQSAGVHHLVVNDSHAHMINLGLAHLLELPGVSLLSGKPKACAMAAGLTQAFEWAIYLGYHAKAGTEKAVLCHSFHDHLWDVSVNGVSYGEGGLNALYASLIHQVPVGLVAGDDCFCQEMLALLPTVQTVQTKTALSFSAALNRPEPEVLTELAEKTHQLLARPATARQESLLTLAPPYELRVRFLTTLAADIVATAPMFDRVDGRTVAYRTDCFEQLYRALQTSYSLMAYMTGITG
ncbi:MAG: M55 family metallopeptidase [Candidatus Melainabacteria bacterium]|nr:M55 family metallopeptidase [Candidatus Melainabacteria bacterium]